MRGEDAGGEGSSMNLDVAILAGGKATRLRGLWDQSKFLVPVGGVPLINRIFENLESLSPRVVYLLLDDRGPQIMAHVKEMKTTLLIRPVFEGKPIGTSGALRGLLMIHESVPVDLRAPLMVLNHDTLPLYPLTALAEHHAQHHGAWATAAFVYLEESWRDVYAGASVLSVEAQREICADHRTHDFPVHLLGAQRYHVPGFLDVGTPEGFKQAQEYRE